MNPPDVTEEAAKLHRLVRKLRSLGRYHAFREGVCPGDIDDCEMTFVERMLSQGVPHANRLGGDRALNNWLHCCAQNHARNYRRYLERRLGRYVPLTTLREQLPHENPLVDWCSPEQLFLQKQLQKSLNNIVQKLMPEVRTMLVDHYLRGQSTDDIANTSGRSRRAVEQALYRARRTMRRALDREGVYDSLTGES